MKEQLFSSLGSINRMHYFLRVLVFIAIPFLVTVLALNFFSHWHHGTHLPLGIFIGLITSLIALFAILMQTLKRLNDLGRSPFYSVLLAIPFVNLLLIVFLICLPGKK